MTTTLRAELEALVADQLNTPLPSGDLADHLDSIQLLSLVVAIEDHFKIAFEPDDEDAAKTLDDVLTILRNKTGRVE